MFIDTHCHLDAAEFNGEGEQVALRAAQVGVSRLIIPAVSRPNFADVAKLGRFGGYALGIHPLYVPQADEGDLIFLREQVNEAMSDPYFIAIGEIGLDFFVPELTSVEMREKQTYFYREQCKIARDAGLPVLLHVRRSVDQILKTLRQVKLIGGIAHAFNGSEQQALMLIQLGFKLGFGGALTYTRALQIRRMAMSLPLSAIVLETDAPDIPPNWVLAGQNSPDQLPKIAQVLADLRNISLEELAVQTTQNACAILPRLRPVDFAGHHATFIPVS
jgi:TatD DNase family protein